MYIYSATRKEHLFRAGTDCFTKIRASISIDGWGGCRPMYFSLSHCDFLTCVKVAAVNTQTLVKR